MLENKFLCFDKKNPLVLVKYLEVKLCFVQKYKSAYAIYEWYLMQEVYKEVEVFLREVQPLSVCY